MAYYCLKYKGNSIKMASCPQLKEDGYCYLCSFYQDFDSDVTLSENTKEKVLSTFVETANLALKRK